MKHCFIFGWPAFVSLMVVVVLMVMKPKFW
jgi:uncharacterized membrane protein